MAVNATSTSGATEGAGAPPKRRLRNYLLDARFQLKYTGYVVVVTLAVASILGYLAYEESKAQTEMLTIGWAMQGETEEFIRRQAEERDRSLLVAIVSGVAILTVVLGLTGIFITHRVVGPAYKLKMLMQHIADGHLSLTGRLRRGDELQDVFRVFEAMVEQMRRNQREEIDLLAKAIEHARESGASAEAIRELEALKARMEAALA